MRVHPRVRVRGTLLVAAAFGLLHATPGAAVAQAADSVVWVFLAEPAPAGAVAPALGPDALARRARHGIPLFANDAPVDAALVRALEDAGLNVRHRSRWLRAVSGTADPGARARIRALDFVTRVQPVAVARAARPRPAESLDLARAVMPPDSFYGAAFAQVEQIGVPIAHELGFTGAGVRVAILDSGFDLDHEAFASLDVVAVRDFIQDDDDVVNEAGDSGNQDDHGTMVLSAVAAYAENELVGPAHGAEFLLAKVDHVRTELRADEDRWVAALEWADSMGATLVSSSLSYRCFDDDFCWSAADLNGDVAPSTIAADAAAARGILVVTAAGNDGRGMLAAPADADSAIAVGAVDANGTLAGFSGTGPTADGRSKPDLVARGFMATVVHPDNPRAYTSANGTSFATPLVAGGAALFMEAWPELSAMAALRALLLSGSIARPDDSLGHGLPNVASAILFPQGLSPLPAPGIGPGGVLASLSPTFAWSAPVLHPAARPVRFIVEIAADSLFGTIVHADTAIDAQVLTLSRPLEAGEDLWWRVVAETAPGVVRTSPPMGPFTMLPWVRLASLNDPEGPFVRDPTPLLVWDPLPAPAPVGPLTYDVDVLSSESGEAFQRMSALADTSVSVAQPLPFNVPFSWRVVVTTAAGAVDTAQSVAPFVVVSEDLPPTTLLYQNFPNPFPRSDATFTTIWFDLDRRTTVSLGVYDLRGRLVRRLIPDARTGCDGRVVLDAGAYRNDANPPCVSQTWDGRTDRGERMPAGVYLIRLRTETESHTVRTLFRP